MFTIDAQGKRLGRIASEAAKALMGKDLPTFRRNKTSGVSVKVVNISKADISERKMKEIIYVRYSGYPGGIKRESAKHLAARRGLKEVFRRAIKGMLPDNKLKDVFMKHLTISE